MSAPRSGADAIVAAAEAAGADVCFANPGTTEMPLVAALDRALRMRSVLGLFEGVCTGAADGFWRMARRPALTLLHLGPGLANGLANLHNARRAGSGVLNVVGDHASWHLAADAPLTSDIASLARPMSDWMGLPSTPEALRADLSGALGAARSGRVASLVVPHDVQLAPFSGHVTPARVEAPSAPDEGTIRTAADVLSGGRAALFLGGEALLERGLRAAARAAAATGCVLLCEAFPARLERGGDLPAVERLPYFPEAARDQLARFAGLVLAGAREPVAFFGYPGGASRLLPEGRSAVSLAGPRDDAGAALEALAERLAGPRGAPAAASAVPEAPGDGPLTPPSIGAVLAALQPEGAIVMEEAVTTGLSYFGAAAGAPRHSLMTLTGGAIGQGLPCATGAAIACPDRKVIAFQADGSGLYTLQSLWTQAREGLDVVSLICANRRYRILDVELARAGVAEPGPAARALTDLGSPTLDWVSLAAGFGVPGERVEDVASLRRALSRALAERGPRLVEMVL